MKNKASDWGGSKLTTFQTCHQKYNLSYSYGGTGLEGIEDSYNRSRGVLVHEALEVFYSSHKSKPLEYRTLEAIKAAVEGIPALNIKEGLKALMKDEIIACLDQYFETYGMDEQLEPLEVEMPFQIKIGDDIHTGTRDLFGMWQGHPVVVDHKSTSLDWDRFFKQFKDDLSLKGYVYDKRRNGVPNCDLLINGIRFKRTKNFACEFQRELISFSEQQMEETPKIIIHVKKEIALCNVEKFWPKSGKQCVTVAGECEFRKYCTFPDEAVIKTFYKQKG